MRSTTAPMRAASERWQWHQREFFDHGATSKQETALLKWSPQRDLNPRPPDYKTVRVFAETFYSTTYGMPVAHSFSEKHYRAQQMWHKTATGLKKNFVQICHKY